VLENWFDYIPNVPVTVPEPPTVIEVNASSASSKVIAGLLEDHEMNLKCKSGVASMSATCPELYQALGGTVPSPEDEKVT
jgi:hypothetical protein